MLQHLWKHRELTYQLTKREVLHRYRGSLLGVFWSFITPLFMLLVYTFVFGVIFRSRWGAGTTSQTDFALILFCGLSIFSIFSDIIGRAPAIILSNPNYVKKVVFPVEILPVTILGSSLIHGAISILILLGAVLIIHGSLPLTVLFLPIVILPLLLVSIGLAWFLASLGVYLRDINQIVPVLVSALMFLSPIFYPVSVIPENLQFLYFINPVSYVVEDARQVVIWGNAPNWLWCMIGTGLGAAIAGLGYAWFQKTKKGFADVI
ncbi:MAG: ABC transporter permease [Deltaproteobacteria bacterium]|nr:ABC transporter permease [Deltaproteobacteria bacterium]